MTMTRNTMFAAAILLAVGAGALGYWIYAEQNRSGVDISIGGHGVSIRER